MREDLKNALNRKWSNYLISFGMTQFIESSLGNEKFETVLYATNATILSTGYIENGKMYSYSVNQNIRGLLILTHQYVRHFSKGKRIEIISLDATEIELKKHLFTSFIQLRSTVSSSYTNIGALNSKEFKMVSNIIGYSVEQQKELLAQKRKRRK
ncbi:MAG: hypothetical protein LC111_09545 [Bacteroidia bacterium]|nr:hypothetical protein [Bacteroidia bacterium]